MKTSNKKSNFLSSLTGFIKYNNTFTIIIIVVFLATGSAFANEGVRNTVIGETIATVAGIDNTQILVTDIDNFNMNFTIQNITEDDNMYYIDYSYNVVAIIDNVWQPTTKEETLNVSKERLGGNDLGLYVASELGQLADYELSYMREVKEIEKKNGERRRVASIAYTGLKGLVLDPETKILPGYTPVIKEDKGPELVGHFDPAPDSSGSQGAGAGSTDGVVAILQTQIVYQAIDKNALREIVQEMINEQQITIAESTAQVRPELENSNSAEYPIITINGNNPANINVGDTYNDLGATVTDNKDNNLGIKIFVNNVEVNQIQLDTSTSTTYTITYSATDQDGNTTTAKRIVIVSEVESVGGGQSSGSLQGGERSDLEEQMATTTPEIIPDTTAPIISLIGNATIDITVGDSYTDAGATASDPSTSSGQVIDLTDQIVVNNQVDTMNAGTYIITYNVSDTAGNDAVEVTRIITIVEPVVEVIPDIIEDTATSTATTTS